MKPPSFLNPDDYALPRLLGLSTPRLLVYRRFVEENIARMRRYLETAAPGSGFRHLAPHVKTNKSTWAAQLLMQSGVEHFKCTPNELDMLLQVGARRIFVAYPLLPPQAEKVARAAAENRQSRITVQVSSLAQAECIAAAARAHDVELDGLIDLDVGNHRTGIPVAAAPDLARAMARSPALGPLKLRGLHAYDGHNNSPDAAEREAEAERAMGEVAECARALGRAGVRVERVVAGGTPAFLPDLLQLVARHRLDAEVQVSPGTWIYWDSGYDCKMPGLFVFAAILLARVMDLPGDDLLTLDLGYKRWAIDHGPVDVFSAPGLEFVSASEEHTVLRSPGGRTLQYGDPVLFAPRHVCPTVNLWESFTLVGREGDIEAEALPVSGRNR